MTEEDPSTIDSSKTKSKSTMYMKYHDVWSKYSAMYGKQTAVFYQVGGFFEIYDTENLITGVTQSNVREVAKVCRLSLSIHAKDDGVTQTLFGGFPESALASFESVLVSANWTVVVIVQKKGKGKGKGKENEIERVVDHISSPGFSNSTDKRLVGCIIQSVSSQKSALHRIYWAVSTIHITTGRIQFIEGDTMDRLNQFLCMYPPGELVLWSDGLAAANSVTDILKTVCPVVHIKCLRNDLAMADEVVLGQFWSLGSLPWIHCQPHSRRCLAALMEFANDHIPSALVDLDPPEQWSPDGEVRVGNTALVQLGVVSDEVEKKTVLTLIDQCRTNAGKQLLRSRLLRPITNITILNSRLDAIYNTKNRDPVKTVRGLRSLYDIAMLWRKIELGTATMTTISCLLRSFEAAKQLGFGPSDNGMFFTWIFSQWDLTSTIDMARESVDVPVTRLPFVHGAFPAIDALFAEGLEIRARGVALCDEWSVTTKKKKENLYFEDTDGGGFRITGTARRIGAAVAVLHEEGDRSAKSHMYKSTSMITTDTLDALSTAHRRWIARWVTVWKEHWSTVLSTIVDRGRIITLETETWCADLDVSWTIATIAEKWNWTRPVFIDCSDSDSSLEVVGLRHPIIERIINVPYVSHSIDLTKQKGNENILLYGMNASGKSSLMKSLGIAVLLAQSGFPVPATMCRLRPFTSIFTRILSNDNLCAGMSSFVVEMTEFREILRFADNRSLVLGDELCSGTESMSATALVASGIETLVSRGTKFVFATHLHELATLIPDSVRTMHMKVESVGDHLIYDRTLSPGPGPALYGLEVCHALDLPAEFLERASLIRKQLMGWVAPHKSVYSSKVVVSKCEICSGTVGLETHHIIAQVDGGGDDAGNLVCLCSACHDAHHGGRILISGWTDIGMGNREFKWSPISTEGGNSEKSGNSLSTDVQQWVREQRLLKIRVPVIQRMAKQMFGVELTVKQIKTFF